MPKKTMYLTQEVLYSTELFGKPYFWMKDVDGSIYLVKDINGTPDFSSV